MTVEFTKLSSKGQIVIPQDIRQDLHLKEGTPFAVTSQDDMILLKKIEMPRIKPWREAVKPFRKAAKMSGFKKEELDVLIEEVRRSGK